MYVPGRTETVDWSQKPLLCPQYEHIEAGGTHEKECVMSTYNTCVHINYVYVTTLYSLIQRYTSLFMDIAYYYGLYYIVFSIDNYYTYMETAS